MRKFDKPLFWVYAKTKDLTISQPKGFLVLVAVIIATSIAFGSFRDLVWVTYFLSLLTMFFPISFTLVLVRLKFNYAVNEIPTPGVAYILQSNVGTKAVSLMSCLISIYISTLLYMFLIMSAVAAVAIPIMTVMSQLYS